MPSPLPESIIPPVLRSPPPQSWSSDPPAMEPVETISSSLPPTGHADHPATIPSAPPTNPQNEIPSEPPPDDSAYPTVEVEGDDLGESVRNDELLEEVVPEPLEEGVELLLQTGDHTSGSTDDEPFFPSSEPGTGTPVIETSVPSREQSNVIRMASTLGELEKARFTFLETAKLTFDDVQDLGTVLLHAQWIPDEARMRKVIIQALIAMDPESYRPRLLDLEIRTDFDELASLFLQQLTLSKQKSLRQRLEKSRSKLNARPSRNA